MTLQLLPIHVPEQIELLSSGKFDCFEMGRIGALVPDDIPRGAELYWHFRARDPELAPLVHHSNAFRSRLDGEWCLNMARQSTRARAS